MVFRTLATVIAVALAVVFSLTASAKPVVPTSVTASASHTQDDYTFEPAALSDDRLYNFWVAGGEGGGLQQHVKFVFDGSVPISGMEIWNGCQVDQDSFEARGKAKKLALKMGFDELEVEVEDTYGKQVIKFEKTYTVSNIRIFFKGLFKGKSWDQISISELHFIDDDEVDYITGVTAEASASLEGGDYGPENLVDTFEDSMWCEGVKEGDEEDRSDRKKGEEPENTTSMDSTREFTQKGAGTGEWVKLNLGGKRSVGRVGIIIGDSYDEQSFNYSSRPKVLKVQFSDRTKQTWELQDTSEWQYLDVSGVSADWVKFTIEEATLGKRYNDTTIAEIRLWTD